MSPALNSLTPDDAHNVNAKESARLRSPLSTISLQNLIRHSEGAKADGVTRVPIVCFRPFQVVFTVLASIEVNHYSIGEVPIG